MGLLDGITEDQILGGLLGAGAASGAKGNFLARMAAGIGEGQKFGAWREQKARQRSKDEMWAEFQQLQKLKMQRDAEREQRADTQMQTNTDALRSALSPMDGMGALAGGGGPTLANAEKIGQQQPFDVRQFIAKNPGVDLQGIQQYMALGSAMNPKRKIVTGKPGDVFYDEGDMSKPLGSVPEKVAPIDYNKPFLPDGTPNKAYQDYSLTKAKTGATQIGMPKIDIKMGDSVAGQVGPMGQASRTKAEGAVTMFDAAERIQKALESGKVSAGPGSAAIQNVKQLIQKVSGGNDDNIRQTQQVIRSLAKMAVEARKQLAGQGQVTENEAKAVERADGGNIDDLTTGELQDLVTLTKRASHFAAQSHQEFLSTMEANDGTRGAAPFYRVRGLDPLLKHVPQLPQIGGGGDVRSRADAILNGSK